MSITQKNKSQKWCEAGSSHVWLRNDNTASVCCALKDSNKFPLDENSNFQILVPPMFGVAHLVLSKKCILSYKQSTYYGQNKQFTVSYKSKCLNFWKTIAFSFRVPCF